MAQATIRESCQCGATIDLKTDETYIKSRIEEWRLGHRHELTLEEESDEDLFVELQRRRSLILEQEDREQVNGDGSPVYRWKIRRYVSAWERDDV